MSAESQTNKSSFFGRSPFVAYVAAVTSAAFCFVMINFILVISNGGFESATNNSLNTKITHLSLIMLLTFIIGWLFAFITAFIPFILGWFVAKKFNINHGLFFIFGAAFTGILLTPISASIPELAINVQGAAPSLMQKSLKASPIFSGCGAFAGYVCWRILRRQ